METKKDLFAGHVHLILTKLYKLHFEQLYASAMSHVQDDLAAANIAHDSFLDFADHLSKILDASRIANLLASYTEKKCQAFLQNIECPIELDYPLQHYWENDIETEDWCLIVRNAVAGLPLRRKQIIRYIFWDGLTTDETAIKMGLSRQTIINQKNKAFHWLKSVIRNEASKLN